MSVAQSPRPDKLPWHDRPWRRLMQARADDRLPHAILLAGPEGVGKSAFARRLALALICPTPLDSGDACGRCAACHHAEAGSYPDQHWIQPSEPGKAIKIDAIRALANKSTLTVQQGGHRVAVIDPADAMNPAAANALLKTLEEPMGRSLLALVSSRPDQLPATIRSRCQTLRFPVPPAALAHDWLAGQTDGAGLDELLAISDGAPLRALDAQAQGWTAADRNLIDELARLRRRADNPLQIVENWRERPINHLIEGLKRCLADLIRLGSGAGGGRFYHPGERAELQTLGHDLELRRLCDLYDELVQLQRELIHNLNSQMMLEHLANRWLQITRPGGR